MAVSLVFGALSLALGCGSPNRQLASDTLLGSKLPLSPPPPRTVPCILQCQPHGGLACSSFLHNPRGGN